MMEYLRKFKEWWDRLDTRHQGLTLLCVVVFIGVVFS